MIELERTEPDLWITADEFYAIVELTSDIPALNYQGPGFYVRDNEGDVGPFRTLDEALHAAELRWGEVTLAPANRLRRNIDVEDECDAGNYLLEYLAYYGTAGIDAQALARRVFERIEES
jgi:hypothetical protein